MLKEEWMKQAQAYNKTITKGNLTPLQKHYVTVMNAFEGYYLWFDTNVDLYAHIDDDVMVFLQKQHGFQGLLKTQADRLAIYLKEITSFSYTRGTFRITARSPHLRRQASNIMQAIGAFYITDACALDITDLIQGRYEHYVSFSLAPVMAAAFLAGDETAITAAKEVLTSENNTGVLTRELIDAIAMSRHEELQDLLLQVFVAARLQEGLRQSVAESCDMYQLSFFQKTVKIILEENLIRYSSIQRAVMCWCGLGYEAVEDKEVKYLLGRMAAFMDQEEARHQALFSTQPLDTYLALYVQGTRNVETAQEEAIALFAQKQAQLTASAIVYLSAIQGFASTKHLSLFEEYEEDSWIQALLYSHLHFSKGEKGIFANGEEAYAFAKRIEGFVKTMKAEQSYSSKGFAWFSLRLYRSQVASCLLDLYHCYPREISILEIFLPYAPQVLYGDGLRSFMYNDFPKVSRQAQSTFLLKNIIANNEQLQQLVKERLLKLELSETEILQLEDRLKTKKGNARGHIVDVLAHQKKEVVQASYERLRKDSLGNRQNAAKELARKVPHILQKESKKETPVYTMREGLGLYERKAHIAVPFEVKVPRKTTRVLFKKKDSIDFSEIFVWDAQDMEAYLKRWSLRIEEHGDKEYEHFGSIYQVRSYLYPNNYQQQTLDAYPYADIWKAYFQEDDLSASQLFSLMLVTTRGYGEQVVPLSTLFQSAQGIVNESNTLYDIPHYSTISTLLQAYYEDVKKQVHEVFFHHAQALLSGLLVDAKEESYRYVQPYTNHVIQASILTHNKIAYLLTLLEQEWQDEEEFKEVAPLVLQLYERFTRAALKAKELHVPSTLFLAKAVHLDLLNKERLYEGILEPYDENSVYVSSYSRIHANRLWSTMSSVYLQGRGLNMKKPKRTGGIAEAKYQDVEALLVECLDTITDRMLASECARINAATDVSPYIQALEVVFGVKRLLQLIQALGEEDFVRNMYGNDKRTNITYLVKHCWPLADDQPQAFAQSGIKEERLVEIAMLAPQWIPLVSAYLKWDGFQEGCYYFIAHMKEASDDEKKAEIAKYTDLDPLDLRDGAFDMDWCASVYKRLGEKRFQVLYKAAKFLCENSCHTRARKYADACLGKSKKEDLWKQVAEKRNKDALNAYCIVPLKDEQDLLERYEQVQLFAKQSKQFGSQRQASEKRCAQIALLNLARNAGYSDVMRLTWRMEARMVDAYAAYRTPQCIEDYEAWIDIAQDGKSKLRICKNGKLLASVPAKLKKQETIAAMKEVVATWNQQQRRSKALLETAMEEQTTFTWEEMQALMHNPIVAPLLSALVMKQESQYGFLSEEGLYGPDKDSVIDKAMPLQIAHPYDLYTAKLWPQYQQYIFDHALVQPFKQVFRELYLKLEDEKNQAVSKRYSGYQIQVQKAAAALKSRKWNLSYEEGMERILYHQDLIVHLYAEADWFSPADIEAPSIDYVEFTHRKSGKPVCIKDIDAITYSEIMRDLDMAVSIAYVGGVDPLTSASTMELRASIIAYTMKLMKLDNVEIKGHFANIHGCLNDYSLHLGSGIIHQFQGSALHILAVHSQKRGKLYLPFLDEDPKTAEIVSKIILLAEDHKLKDPTILSQIQRRDL